MSSDNPPGAGNQQGRSRGRLAPQYVAGFVDGEGCFSVSVHPHPTVRYGRRWLIAPCFQVYQHRDHVSILEELRDLFACGHIRPKGPKSSVLTYSVYRRRDLESTIIAYFERYPFLVLKRTDFEKFSEIVRMMQQGLHREDEGFRRIVEIAFSMNQRGKQRRYRLEDVLAEPSETARRASVERMKIQSDPHGDLGRAAEMTVPPQERLW